MCHEFFDSHCRCFLEPTETNLKRKKRDNNNHKNSLLPFSTQILDFFLNYDNYIMYQKRRKYFCCCHCWIYLWTKYFPYLNLLHLVQVSQDWTFFRMNGYDWYWTWWRASFYKVGLSWIFIVISIFLRHRLSRVTLSSKVCPWKTKFAY